MSEPFWLTSQMVIAIHDEQLALHGGPTGLFIVPEADAAAMILSLAAGRVTEEGLTRWIRDNWPT